MYLLRIGLDEDVRDCIYGVDKIIWDVSESVLYYFRENSCICLQMHLHLHHHGIEHE